MDCRPRCIRSTIRDSCNCAPKAAKPAIISQMGAHERAIDSAATPLLHHLHSIIPPDQELILISIGVNFVVGGT